MRDYALTVGDTSLILAQRLGEWIGHAPALEEDLALANIALDLLGQARYLLSHAAQLQGGDGTEDDLAFLRDPQDFLNLSLVEQPNGDFAMTMGRQLLFDAYQLELWESVAASSDSMLAGLAKRHNTSTAREVLAEARDLLGGNGLLLDFHVIRHMTDIEAVHTYEGTESMQTLIVGRDITGHSAFA